MFKKCETCDDRDTCQEACEDRKKLIDLGIDGVKQYLNDVGFSAFDRICMFIQAAIEEAQENMTVSEFVSAINVLLGRYTEKGVVNNKQDVSLNDPDVIINTFANINKTKDKN